MARLYDVHTPLPAAKTELMELAKDLTPLERPGDYAQAVMDLGATICTPKSPACGICPWRDECIGRIAGTAPMLPKKTPKKPVLLRRGIAYVARRADGAWLLETRDPNGLLGGMLGFAGSDWSGDPQPAPPLDADWQRLDATARHTFTHFHLELEIMWARVPDDSQPARGHFMPHTTFSPTALPTVMRKVFDLVEDSLPLD